MLIKPKQADTVGEEQEAHLIELLVSTALKFILKTKMYGIEIPKVILLNKISLLVQETILSDNIPHLKNSMLHG